MQMDPRGQIGVRERDASYRDGTSMCTHAHSLPLVMSTVPSDGNMSDSDFEEHVVACDRMSGMETNIQVHSLKEGPSQHKLYPKRATPYITDPIIPIPMPPPEEPGPSEWLDGYPRLGPGPSE
jgi:hypothetical protein